VGDVAREEDALNTEIDPRVGKVRKWYTPFLLSLVDV
jgi:phage host-nuclease inhibitor protein Gam